MVKPDVIDPLTREEILGEKDVSLDKAYEKMNELILSIKTVIVSRGWSSPPSCCLISYWRPYGIVIIGSIC